MHTDQNHSLLKVAKGSLERCGSEKIDRTAQEGNVDRTTKNGGLRPTIESYGELEGAFDFFNDALFEGIYGARLSNVMLTMPKSRRFQGYFEHRGWTNEGTAQRASEIALNPRFFQTPTAVFQTLVHEMVHLAQAELPEVYGKPGKHGYHGKSFAAVMMRLGLMPSSTGAPGGAMTGFRMSDYVIPGGPFEKACRWFLERGNKVSWASPASVRANENGVNGTGANGASPGDTINERKRRSKTKYSCHGCGLNAWAKPGATLICGSCHVVMIAAGDEPCEANSNVAVFSLNTLS